MRRVSGENVAEKTTSATSATIAAPVPAPWSWFSSLSIDEQFLLLGKRRVCVPGDGHCLLHSWLRVLQAEGERENQTPLDLLNDVNKEIEDNLLVHYVAFLTGDWNLQMEAYLYHRVYNSDVVDLVIFALSNLSARICELYTVDSGSVKKAFVITPWKEERAKLAREKPTLSLLFRGKHYDPLLNIDLNSSVKTTVEQEEDTSDEEKDTTNENKSKAESTSLLDEEGVTKDQRPEPVVPEIADPVRKATKVESAESAEDNEDFQEMTENVTPDDSVKTQDIEADSIYLLIAKEGKKAYLKKIRQELKCLQLKRSVLNEPQFLSAALNESTTANNTSIVTTTSSPSINISRKEMEQKCNFGQLSVCWRASPPYIMNDTRSGQMTGIFHDAINNIVSESCNGEVDERRNASWLHYNYEASNFSDLTQCMRGGYDIVLPILFSQQMEDNSYLRIRSHKLIRTPGIAVIKNGKKLEEAAKANVLDELKEYWTVLVLVVLLSFIFGILMWFLIDELFTCYGDKAPRFLLARIVAVIWMFLSVIVMTYLTGVMTATLTFGTLTDNGNIEQKKVC
ncbi:hypothetical protein P5673_016916 [Acropora cervicornis]|uniref:OTU domain-containing protein n=1 Tax=Acropora cervicornis TaxID=6130 RepID=A0AAD9QFY5_ACRCE|nr:hypothetical protein P5673_016916 [Acropora cervicornis]